MTLTSSVTLFLSMVVLALIPGPGILTVTARSSSSGFRHGISTTVGIVAGSSILITLALLGLAASSEALGGLFVFVKYLGAIYLIGLGISIALSKPNNGTAPGKVSSTSSHLTSFSAGLIATVGNPKAVLFYLSFFPAFLDLSQISFLDATIIYIASIIAVGGVMLSYAYVAVSISNRVSNRTSKRGLYLRYVSGIVLVSCGIYVMAV